MFARQSVPRRPEVVNGRGPSELRFEPPKVIRIGEHEAHVALAVSPDQHYDQSPLMAIM